MTLPHARGATNTGEASTLTLAHQPLFPAHSTLRLLLQTEPEVLPLLCMMPTLCANKRTCRTPHTPRHLLPFSPLRSARNTFLSQVRASASGCRLPMMGDFCNLPSAFSDSADMAVPTFPGCVQRGKVPACTEHLL